MNKIPRIEIKYGRLLDPFFIEYSKHKYPEWVPSEEQVVKERVESFKAIWEDVGEKILTGIMQATGLSFVRDVFDVYIVSGTPRDMSDPVIIRSRYEPDEFVGVVAHELIHRFLTLNRIELWHSSEPHGTRVHVYVFAILTHIYINALKDENGLEKIKYRVKDPEYRRAWEIVDEEGYEKIISNIKKAP